MIGNVWKKTSDCYAPRHTADFKKAACLLMEVVVTAIFPFIIMENAAPTGFAYLAIGLALALIHVVSIPVTYTPVNPARNTGSALFVRGQSNGYGSFDWHQ